MYQWKMYKLLPCSTSVEDPVLSAHKFDTFQRSAVYTYRQGCRLNEIVRTSACCMAFADVIDRKSLLRTARVSHMPGSRFSWYYFISDSSIVVHNNIESASINVTYLAHDDRTRLWVQRNVIILLYTSISTHENRRYTRVVHNLYMYYIMYVYTRATPFWRATHSRRRTRRPGRTRVFYFICYYYYLLLSDLMTGARQKY